MRGIRRAPVGEGNDHVEQLKRTDDREEGGDSNRGTDQGNLDVAHDRPVSRAFDAGRLYELARHRLESGDIDHHVETEVFPHHDDRNREHREALVSEDEDRLAADRPEEGGGHASVSVEYETPNKARGDFRENVWKEEDQSKQRIGGRLFIHEQGQQERERELHEERDGQNDRGVADRLPEYRATEDLGEVRQSDEVRRRSVAVPLEQGIVARIQQRQGNEEAKERQRGRQQDRDRDEATAQQSLSRGAVGHDAGNRRRHRYAFPSKD